MDADNGQWAYGNSVYDAALPNIVTLESNYSSRVSIIRDRAALAFLTNESENPSIEQSQIAQDALNDYGITEGKSKVLVTTQKLRYNQMLLGIDELKLIDNLNIDFEKICNVNGIDPLIFSSRSSTYENQEKAQSGTVKKAIVPLATHFYTKFNEFLRPKFNGLRILPKIEEVAEMEDLGLEQSKKVLEEVKAGVLSRSQAFNLLYPDEMTFEGTDETQEPNNLQLQEAQVNGNLNE